MKLTCLKKDLEKAVDISSRIISNNTLLPVLQCVLLEVIENQITLKATNLELSIETKFIGESKEDGEVAIPASVFARVIKTIRDDGYIKIESDGDSIVIESGKEKTTINTVNSEEFPKIPDPEVQEKYKIPAETLIQGIKTVSSSASTSSIKPELSSVFIYHEDDKLVFVATDQFRLCEKRISFESENEIPSIIMPIRNATELIRVLETSEGDVDVYIDADQFSVKTNSLYITSRVIDGSFPDYKVIIPKETNTEIIMLKSDFANMLKKMQIFADKFGKMNLHIYPKEKTLTASAYNNIVGEVFDSPDAVLKGEDLDIAFNHKYLIDSINVISTDSVVLEFSGTGKPLLIKGLGDDSITYLVMPMNR